LGNGELGEGGARALGNDGRAGQIGIGEQGCEFIAADAATGVRRAVRDFGDGTADRAQDVVARGVTEIIVVRFEVVDIERYQGDRRAGESAGFDRLLQLHVVAPTVI